jgi:hypothetical protein
MNAMANCSKCATLKDINGNDTTYCTGMCKVIVLMTEMERSLEKTRLFGIRYANPVKANVNYEQEASRFN